MRTTRFQSLLLIILSGAIFTTVAAAQSGSFAGGDLLNFTYQPSCASEDGVKPIKVVNGEYSYEKPEDGYVDRFYFKVFDIVYGDLTGDGKDEAVALTICNTGGTGNFSEGFIFEARDNKPVLIATLPGGDRAYGGIRKAKIENGRLIVETNDPGELGGACCPTEVVTSTYRLADGVLKETSKAQKRPLYPSQRVAFSRGSSQAVVQLSVLGDEGAELVLRANKGQTMTVSIDKGSVDAQLVNDSKLTVVKNGFRAILGETGDQTIRLDNTSSEPVSVTVTISIR